MSKAKAILGESSQKIRCQIPYHSSEFKKLKARLGLLKLVRTEVNNRRLQGGQPFPPSRAMRKAWDSGLYPESDAPGTVEKMGLPKFTMLSDLWSAENCQWALEWLRYLSQQIARTEEEIRLLRQREIQQSAEKRRKDAIERMSAGGELRHLLHPPSCLPHSPALRTNFPDSLHLSGSTADIEALILRLQPFQSVIERDGEEKVTVSGICWKDLHMILRKFIVSQPSRRQPRGLRPHRTVPALQAIVDP